MTKSHLKLLSPTVSLVGNFGHHSASLSSSSSSSSSSRSDSRYNHHQSAAAGKDEVANSRGVAMLSVQVRKLAAGLLLLIPMGLLENTFLEYFIGRGHIFQRAWQAGRQAGRQAKGKWVKLASLSHTFSVPRAGNPLSLVPELASL